MGIRSISDLLDLDPTPGHVAIFAPVQFLVRAGAPLLGPPDLLAPRSAGHRAAVVELPNRQEPRQSGQDDHDNHDTDPNTDDYETGAHL
jgi:hypothetical protein